MKTQILAITVALLILAVPVLAQTPELISAKTTKHIWTRGAFGSGIAISQSDPMDFELLKLGIAGVKLVTEDVESVVKTGVLYFGEDKYRLKDVVIGNATASATIYYNDTQVGTISLDSYLKGDREIWAGTLTLNDVTYNAYIIQVPKVVKAVEKAKYIYQYCKDHPVICRGVMKAVGREICDPEAEGETCMNQIQAYCEDNPDEARCKALRLAYCKLHPEDADCRAEMKGVCQNDNTDNACRVLTAVYNKNIQKKPTVADKMPEWFHTVRAKISNAASPTNAGNVE